jgi:hypothetical protein
MKLKRVFISVFAIILVSVSYGYSQKSVIPVDELTDIAKNSLVSKNKLLIDGYSDVDLEHHPFAPSYRKAVRSDSEEILSRRESLIANGVDYSDFQTELTIKQTKAYKTKTVLKATERTVLRLHKADTDPLAPKTTEYVREHVFTFVYDKDGQWKLSSDKLINMPRSVTPRPGERTIEIEVESTLPNERYAPEAHTLKVSKDFEISKDTSLETVTQANSLNRAAIVEYAYKYWENYNSEYRRWDNDCTNFVSQAVREGGWTFVKGFYRSSKHWWYIKGFLFLHNQTWSWAGAQNWYEFISQRPRGDVADYTYEMEPGDILQMDITSDGHIDHSMIVTKKDSSGIIYLTYHSNDTKDKSVLDIAAGSPDASFYGWRLKESFD